MFSPRSRDFSCRLGGVGAFFAELSYFTGGQILFGEQLFGLGDGGAALRVQFAELFYRQRESARRQALRDRVEIGAKRPHVMHIDSMLAGNINVALGGVKDIEEITPG